MYKQELLLLRYNKDVQCVIDKNKTPVCKTVSNARRNEFLKNNNIPSHDPYIPRVNTVFYNCSSAECATITLYSMTQVTSPDLSLKACYLQADTYQCENIRFVIPDNSPKIMK
ncbi:unnamed protein product [Chilo suppressalis]|uniref:Uncharacterized protein n=1 Tax=Chilo suppressalis TaxID=168631 RepID=A0ABN8BF26_CHISP|nr:unnamed protein product [Chilo suppressalis]